MNALKSIFGSIHSSKAINEIEKLGISVYKFSNDGVKQFRNVEDVLVDVMLATKDTTANLEDLFKGLAGGKWQWNKMGAIVDYKEFITALNLSLNSQGMAAQQVAMQMDTLIRKFQTLKNELERMSASSGGLRTVLKGLLDVVIKVIKILNNMPESTGHILLALGGFKVVYSIFGKLVPAISSFKAGITAATSATTAFGAATSILTRLNPIIGILSAITLGWGIYESVMTSAGNKIDESTQKLNGLNQQFEMQKAELENIDRNLPYIDTLTSALRKLNEQYANTEDMKEREKINEEIGITEETLAKITSETAKENMKSHGYNEESVNNEKDAYAKSKDSIQESLKSIQTKIIDTSREVALQCDSQIESINNEADAFDKAADAIGAALGKIAEYQFRYYRWKGEYLNGYADQLDKESARSTDAEWSQKIYETTGIEYFKNRAERNNSGASEFVRQVRSSAVQANKDADTIKTNAKSNITNSALGALREANNAARVGGGTPPSGSSGDVSTVSGSKNNNAGSSALPSTKAKQEKNLLKTQKDDDFTKSKLSADRYAEALSNLSLMQDLYGNSIGSTVARQQVMRDRVSELTKENERYQNVMVDLDKKIDETINADKNWLDAMDITQDKWNEMSKDDKRAFVLQRRDILETSDSLKNLTVTLNDYSEKASSTKKKITEMQNDIIKLNFSGVFDKEKIYQRQLEEIDFAEKMQKNELANKQYIPEYNERTRQIELEALTQRRIVQEGRLKELEEDRVELQKGLPNFIGHITSKLTETEDKLKILLERNNKAIEDEKKKQMELADLKQKLSEDQGNPVLNADIVKKNAEVEGAIRACAEATREYADAQEYSLMLNQFLDAANRGDTATMNELSTAIRGAKLNLSDTNVQLERTKDKFKDVREKGASVFNDLIVQGASFKDIWKRLWNELATDAINALFKVQNGNHGLLSSLLGIFGGKAPALGSREALEDGIGKILAHDGGKVTKMHSGGKVMVKPTLADDEVTRTLQVGERVLSKEDNKRFESFMPQFKELTTNGPEMVPSFDKKIIQQTQQSMADNKQTRAQLEAIGHTNEILTGIVQQMATQQEKGGNVVVLNSTDVQQVIQMVPQGLGSAVMQFMDRQGRLGRGNYRG